MHKNQSWMIARSLSLFLGTQRVCCSGYQHPPALLVAPVTCLMLPNATDQRSNFIQTQPHAPATEAQLVFGTRGSKQPLFSLIAQVPYRIMFSSLDCFALHPYTSFLKWPRIQYLNGLHPIHLFFAPIIFIKECSYLNACLHCGVHWSSVLLAVSQGSKNAVIHCRYLVAASS